jgi:hypothetical protein
MHTRDYSGLARHRSSYDGVSYEMIRRKKNYAQLAHEEKVFGHVRRKTPTHAKTQKHKDKTKYNRAYTVDDIDVLI